MWSQRFRGGAVSFFLTTFVMGPLCPPFLQSVLAILSWCISTISQKACEGTVACRGCACQFFFAARLLLNP